MNQSQAASSGGDFVGLTRLTRVRRNFNRPLLIAVFLLLAYGLFVLFSATNQDPQHTAFFWQIGFAAVGTGLAIWVALVDYHIWLKLAYPLYFIALILLLGVLLFAPEVFGAQRWLNIGPIPIQPSEIAKVAVILVLAKELSGSKDRERPFIRFLRALTVIILPMLLIYEQPDLGTSIVVLFLFFPMCSFAAIRPLYTFSFFGAILASTPLLWYFLREYQRNRILVLLDPTIDPLGIGYNLRQALITIGSGGFLGKGYLQGSQKQLQFLPVRHTDFIFSVLAEELGFLGVTLLLSLYAALFLLVLRVAQQAEDEFGALLVIGILGMWVCHVFVNIGMNAGIMPVTGIWLPFFSYGGASTLINLLSVGIILSVSLHRRRFMFYPGA
ncbi:MAG: rod shape-determining protein RodA [bacterium]